MIVDYSVALSFLDHLQVDLLHLWHSLVCQISYSSLFNSNRTNEQENHKEEANKGLL